MTLPGSSAVPPWRTESINVCSASSGSMGHCKINYDVMLRQSDSLKCWT